MRSLPHLSGADDSSTWAFPLFWSCFNHSYRTPDSQSSPRWWTLMPRLLSIIDLNYQGMHYSEWSILYIMATRLSRNAQVVRYRVGRGGGGQNVWKLLNLRALKCSPANKIHIFQCMGKIFEWNFRWYLWNSTQNILPIHGRMHFSYNVEITILKFMLTISNLASDWLATQVPRAFWHTYFIDKYQPCKQGWYFRPWINQTWQMPSNEVIGADIMSSKLPTITTSLTEWKYHV